MNLLIVGGNGTLGRQIVRRALEEGYQVRCLVRNLRRSSFLKDLGADLVYGDLSLPETLPLSLKGIDVIIDTATVRSTDDYNAEKIDWRGKIALLEASKLAKIKKFIFFSIISSSENATIPLLDLKIRVTKLIENSSISYTIFQCSGFFQGLINQYAVPTLEKQKIWLLGDVPPTAYIDTQDAANIVVASLSNTSISVSQSLPLIGVKAWKPEDIIKLCERLSGQESKIAYIPSIFLGLLRRFFRCFEFTWNVADRLQFSELKSGPESMVNKKLDIINNLPLTELLTLEQYLQEYFGKILKKLKETNYQQSKRNNDISFL
jgi:uncharacterized protein YbjT (DUF2867 family)